MTTEERLAIVETAVRHVNRCVKCLIGTAAETTIKNIEYVKDASGDLRRIPDIIRLSGRKINIFCGGEDLAFENFILCATGWICVCANIIPRKVQQLFELGSSKNRRSKKTIFEIYPLLEMLEHSPKAIQIVKTCLNNMGHAGGTCRLPRMPLSVEEEKQVIVLLEDPKIMQQNLQTEFNIFQ